MFSAMGIFSFSSTNTKDQNQAPLKISEPVLASLGLTQEDVDSHNKNLVQQEAIKYGTSYYKEIQASADITSASPIKLGPIALNTNTKDKQDLIDSLYSQVVPMEAVMTPPDLEKIKIYLEGFTFGYGQSALEAKDWQTAVKAFDNVASDGIEKNTEVLTKLGQIFRDDKDTRIAIANLIQERINSRTPKASPTPVNTPTPFEPITTQPEPKLNINPTPYAPTPLPQAVPTTIANLTNEKLPGEITDSSGIVLRPVPKAPNSMASLTS